MKWVKNGEDFESLKA